MLNNVSICGRLVKEIMLQQVGENVKTIFTLAVQRDYKDKEGNYPTDFIDCEAWNQAASFLEQYANKGDTITVSGAIRKDAWKTDEGWNSRVYVAADRVHIIRASGAPEEAQEKPKTKTYRRK